MIPRHRIFRRPNQLTGQQVVHGLFFAALTTVALSLLLIANLSPRILEYHAGRARAGGRRSAGPARDQPGADRSSAPGSEHAAPEHRLDARLAPTGPATRSDPPSGGPALRGLLGRAAQYVGRQAPVAGVPG